MNELLQTLGQKPNQMRSAIRFCLVLICCTVPLQPKADQSWAMGKWISDAEATINANSYINSQSPDSIEIYRAMLGKLRWKITDEHLAVIQANGVEQRVPISFHVEDANTIILKDNVNGSKTTLLRTEDAFCSIAAMPPEQILDIRTLECFEAFRDS